MMTINDSVLESSEKITFALRELYLSRGYAHYRMSKFEEYDLYAQNKDFLVSDNVITFTDTGGRLMALKPDVTLSIIKNSADLPEQTRKVFYNENIYRISKNSGSFREIMQSGAECFGKVGLQEICDVITLAADSLKLLKRDAVLALSDLDILSALIDQLKLSPSRRAMLYQAIGEKNVPEIKKLSRGCCDTGAAETLCALTLINEPAAEALPKLDQLLNSMEEYAPFREVLDTLCASDGAEMLRVDFSVTGDLSYYNGIIFKGFLREIPDAVLSGGQYDRLMRRLYKRSCAIGFAVYTDAFERLDPDAAGCSDDGYINIALPKGRLGEKVYALFADAGYDCPSILEPGRRLVFENPEKGVRYFWVKPSDVAIYVERGAADMGVVGKDILMEYNPDVYELLDVKKGLCRMAVAAPKGFLDDCKGTLRVATKFAGIARDHYRRKGRDIDIIHLNGSIEIAPILGLSDVIVDIVETGTTLKENNLEVIEEVAPVSARLIANKVAHKFRSGRIDAIVRSISALTEEEL